MAPAPARKWVTRIDVRYPLNVVGQYPTLHGAEVVLSRADVAQMATQLAADTDARILAAVYPQALKDRAAW